MAWGLATYENRMAEGNSTTRANANGWSIPDEDRGRTASWHPVQGLASAATAVGTTATLLRKRTHCVDGPAIKYDDGSVEYRLHGILFSKEQWEAVISKKMKLWEILTIRDIEMRMATLKVYGSTWLLKEAEAKLIDKSDRGYELWMLDKIFRRRQYFLRYGCPSTGREYVSCIAPDFAEKHPEADLCAGWKWGLDDIKLIKKET